MKRLLMLLVLLAVSNFAYAQNFWLNIYGGDLQDQAKSVTPTSDGGVVSAGLSRSFSAQESAWIVKVNRNGNKVWEKRFGDGMTVSNINQIIEATNGDLIAVGFKGLSAWFLHLDANGVVLDEALWTGVVGTQANFFAIRESNVAGIFYAAGMTEAIFGGRDGLIVKLNMTGNSEWVLAYGSEHRETFFSVAGTQDGGCIAGGMIFNSVANNSDGTLVKVKPDGNLDWAKAYDGGSWDVIRGVVSSLEPITAAPEVFTFVGESNKFDADAKNLWVGSVNLTGTLIPGRQWVYGNVGTIETGQAIDVKSVFGSFVVAGEWTDANEAWVLDLNTNLTPLWQKRYGGIGFESAFGVRRFSFGAVSGYVFAGQSTTREPNNDFFVGSIPLSGGQGHCDVGTQFPPAPLVPETLPGKFIEPLGPTQKIPENQGVDTALNMMTLCVIPEPLVCGSSVPGLSAAEVGEEYHTYMDVTPGTANLEFAIAGGFPDADIYVRFGAEPTTTDWDYRPYTSTNDETVSIPNPPAVGTWYVMVRAYTPYSGVTLSANCSQPFPLDNGVPVSGLAGPQGSEVHYYLDVPAGATNLQFAISGGIPDADIYVKYGAPPTVTDWDYRPYTSTNEETVDIPDPPLAGRWYVMVRGYTVYSGVTLMGNYTP